MRRDLLTAVLHGAVLWALGRMLAVTILSSGAQDVAAVAAATTVTTAAATGATAWVSRSLAATPVQLLRRFLTVPLLLAGLTAYLLLSRDATALELTLGTVPWILGPALSLALVVALRRRRPRSSSMVGEFA
ncbi:hypothetical protein [Ornithinimicrobium pekingense]|uniref:Uncharacterized protein n=1 Tax=Ornithinimicrobium pekingense TaxID=384677 RepID=A0ABQ2FE24_9MICO|nr:hypothetical protein [Ornithinimicrobium pekingense]GGK80444.1 hypothetical protein GCM10011509_31170 [Ornithinimicrobium pekingense]